jgi:hypothetical protein
MKQASQELETASRNTNLLIFPFIPFIPVKMNPAKQFNQFRSNIMKGILAISLLFVVSTITLAQGAGANTKAGLIGIWQNSESVGSGLSDHFQFFADGRFKFTYNSMDGRKRLLSYSGFWNAYKGKLHLHINRARFHIGGKWIKSSGSIATEYEIEGGREMEKRIFPIEKIAYGLSAIRFEQEMYTTILIDGEKFWKLASDPKAYETEE